MSLAYGAENRIEHLKKRAERCVCKFCGEKLRVKNIIFNDIDEVRVEIFCNNCDSIEFGVEPEIYRSARDFVDNYEFNYFPELDMNEKTRKMNIAKVCEILSWGCKNLGVLNQEGFTIPVKPDDGIWAECLVTKSEEINTEKDFEEFVEALSCQRL